MHFVLLQRVRMNGLESAEPDVQSKLTSLNAFFANAGERLF